MQEVRIFLGFNDVKLESAIEKSDDKMWENIGWGACAKGELVQER